MDLKRRLRRRGRRLREWSLRHVQPLAPGLHNLIFFRLRRFLARSQGLGRGLEWSDLRQLFGGDAATTSHWQPLVSVIVPAYNHRPFLEERLNSISAQDYPHLEVILLDDASTDGSADLLRAWASRQVRPTRLVLNESNSGSPFRQWRKGLELARGDLIWIAESDDSCAQDFLSHLVPLFSNPAVMLAHARTIFTDQAGQPTGWELEHYIPELGPDFWRRPSTTSAHELVQRIWARRNLIANVSGAVFRAARHYPLLGDPLWESLRICGDWWFYLCVARGGFVAYCPEAHNYYRQHSANTSVTLHRSERYLQEHLLLAERVNALYALNESTCRAVQRELQERWSAHGHGLSDPELATPIVRVASGSPLTGGRKPNVLMVIYSLVPGGGEILPLRLANLLHGAGYAVTVLDCDQLPSQEGVRQMLNPEVPLVVLKGLAELPRLVRALGIELIHSHHAWADATIAEVLQGVSSVPHVITSHGMYDTMEDEQLDRLGRLLTPWLQGVAYVAYKNLGPLQQMGFEAEQLCKIVNAVDDAPIQPVSRSSLGLPEDALVLCVVSRGIREKGWQEAMEATAMARSASGCDIRLIILGTGPELDRIQQLHQPPWLQTLGFRSNARDYYACADLGVLPSWFQGESQPLTLLECLAAGRPFLASDIGEIRSMLETPAGLAGMVIPLEDGRVPVRLLAEAIARYATNPDLLASHRARVAQAAARQGGDAMLAAHEQFYAEALSRA